MKKAKLSKSDLLSTIDKMSDDQFEAFQKENNREIYQLLKWSEGEDYQSKTAFRLTQELITLITQIEELELIVAENSDNLAASEELAMKQFELTRTFEDLENKTDSFGAVIKLLEKDADKYKAMADLFIKKSKSVDAKIDKIKNHIVNIMTALQLEKSSGAFFSISLGKPTKSVTLNEFTDEEIEALDPKYVSVKKTIDKKAVKESLEKGENIEWASLTLKRNLNIR